MVITHGRGIGSRCYECGATASTLVWRNEHWYCLLHAPERKSARMLTTEQIDKLLDKLNDAAEEVDYYEFGLPTLRREKLYAIVREWCDEN